jgi:predicted alpha/beta-hydrolase family hydrolase
MIGLLKFLCNGPKSAPLTVAFAHGAGAPMDTPFMTFFAEGLEKHGYRVARFEFPYMAARRTDGKKKPPDRQPVLLDTWRAVITEFGTDDLVIGGKSMGGRMASLIADDAGVRGLLCLGYPFYGAGRKDKPRTEHLVTLKTPTLICQGTRDPMGDREAVSALKLSKKIRLHWAEDGDHDLKPRKASGRSHEQNLTAALDAAAQFLAGL